MENVFDLALSGKEKDFVKTGLNTDIDIASNILEVFSNFPYIGSLVKLGVFANKYMELRFIKKLSKFLKRDVEIPLEDKQKFLENLDKKDRARMEDYVMQYLLRAEDDDKATLMGYIYEVYVYGEIDNSMFLRLCSIVDHAFLLDLHELPKYIQSNAEETIAAHNFINLGLIDHYEGGFWKNGPSFKLNEVGLVLYSILNSQGWFGD